MPVARPARRVKARAARILPSTKNQRGRIYFKLLLEKDSRMLFRPEWDQAGEEGVGDKGVIAGPIGDEIRGAFMAEPIKLRFIRFR